MSGPRATVPPQTSNRPSTHPEAARRHQRVGGPRRVLGAGHQPELFLRRPDDLAHARVAAEEPQHLAAVFGREQGSTRRSPA